MFVIGFITLLLLIPLNMIESLITERKVTRKKAVEDITSKWGSEQTIVGPCLVLPYSETIVDGDKRVETECPDITPETRQDAGNTRIVGLERDKRQSDIERLGQADGVRTRTTDRVAGNRCV